MMNYNSLSCAVSVCLVLRALSEGANPGISVFLVVLGTAGFLSVLCGLPGFVILCDCLVSRPPCIYTCVRTFWCTHWMCRYNVWIGAPNLAMSESHPRRTPKDILFAYMVLPGCPAHPGNLCCNCPTQVQFLTRYNNALSKSTFQRSRKPERSSISQYFQSRGHPESMSSFRTRCWWMGHLVVQDIAVSELVTVSRASSQ